MKLEGYIVTDKPFVEANLSRSQVVYKDIDVPAEIVKANPSWLINHVSLEITNPFINDPTDPFVDIGNFREILSPHQYQTVAQKKGNLLIETNEWERIQERHPEKGLMEVYHQHPKEFDKLPLWASVAYNCSAIYDHLLLSGYDGAIHAAEGPHAPVTVYHTFHPARIKFIETLTV